MGWVRNPGIQKFTGEVMSLMTGLRFPEAEAGARVPCRFGKITRTRAGGAGSIRLMLCEYIGAMNVVSLRLKLTVTTAHDPVVSTDHCPLMLYRNRYK